VGPETETKERTKPLIGRALLTRSRPGTRACAGKRARKIGKRSGHSRDNVAGRGDNTRVEENTQLQKKEKKGVNHQKGTKKNAGREKNTLADRRRRFSEERKLSL